MGLVNTIGANGLEVETAAQVLSDLQTGLQTIYPGANVDSNSPDGQLTGIFAQCIADFLESLVQVNNSFDPDQAQGALLDQRVAINNIARIGGTYTVQPITMVTNATVTLAGLDSDYNDPNGTAYTVQDSSGNQFILGATITLTAGTNVLEFRAQNIGPVSVPINTIVTPVTIIAGVVSVNNPSTPVTVGVAQETDAALRIRRAQSVANSTVGNSTGLQANLLALPGVTEAVVYQNRGSTTDGNGTPSHSIWAIIAGGASSQIANLLYNTISDGCGMRGGNTFNIITPSGAPFTAAWDNPTPEPIYIKFNLKRTVPNFQFSIAAIQNYIAANLSYSIGQFAETSSITAIALSAIAAQGAGGVPLDLAISVDGMTYTDYLATATPAAEFTVAAANIAITVE